MKRKPTKKLAISAEAYGEYNQLEEFKEKNISKSKEDIELLTAILVQSFMFKGLDEKALQIVIRAVDVRQFKKDDFVIK